VSLGGLSAFRASMHSDSGSPITSADCTRLFEHARQMHSSISNGELSIDSESSSLHAARNSTALAASC
jgi:hypothetical protein